MHDKPATTRRARAVGPAGANTDAFVTALLTASRTLVGVSARSVAAVEETVTLTQFRTLVVLAGRGGTTLVQLAARLGVNSSTAQRQVDRLLALDLVNRTENPADRREVLIDLTREGSRIVGSVTRRRRAAIAAIVNRMPVVQREGLVTALEAFAEAAGEPSAEADGGAPLGW